MQAGYMLWSRNHYLILAVHAPVNFTALDECDDFLFDLLDAPTKRRCHAVETDGLEWLEVKYDGRVPQMLSEVVHVGSKVHVYIMPRLFQTNVTICQCG